MRHSFYDDPEYKRKQAAITHSKWQQGIFEFKRKPPLIRICANPHCQKEFEFTTRNPKVYCSRHCARVITNTYRKKTSLCIVCGNKTRRYGYKYCSNRCQVDYQYNAYINSWKLGNIDGSIGINTRTLSKHVRRYLEEKYKDTCSLCRWSVQHLSTNKVPLEVDHIDGNSENNSEENLRLICPNCHALTANFRALNKGHGRAWRLSPH